MDYEHAQEDWLTLAISELETLTPKLREGVAENAESLLRSVESGAPLIYPEVRATVDGCFRIEWRNPQGHTLNVSVFGPRNFRWRRRAKTDSGIQTVRFDHREALRRLVSELLTVNRSFPWAIYQDLRGRVLP